VRIAINAFVVGCKTDGTWSAIKTCCILAGARTLNGAVVPLVGTAPTNFNFVSGDYNRKTGLIGNGSSKYLNSGRANNADPQNSNHNVVYLSATGSNIYMGSVNSGNTNAVGSSVSRSRNASSSTSGGLGALGFNAMNRSVSTDYNVRAGGTTTNIVIASAVPTSDVVLVFSRGVPGTPNALTSARISFYSIGESLDLTLFDARVTALITAIGAATP